MEQGTDFFEYAFAVFLFCAACTLLFRELVLYWEIVQKMELLGYGVWHVV